MSEVKLIYKFDPVLYFLNVRLGLTQFWMLLFLYVLAIGLFVLAYFEGVLFDVEYPLVESYHTLVGAAVLPLSTWAVLRHYQHLPNLMGRMQTSGLVKFKADLVTNPYRVYLNRVASKTKFGIAFLIGLSVLVFLQVSWMDDGKHGWTEMVMDKSMSWTGAYFFCYFMVFVSVFFNFIANSIFLQQLFIGIEKGVKNGTIEFRFKRISADGLSGVAPISKLIKQILTPLIFTGLFSSSIIPSISQHVEENSAGMIISHFWVFVEFGLAVLYILGLFVLVSILLFPIHRILKFEKNKLISALGSWDSNKFKLSQRFLSDGMFMHEDVDYVDRVDKIRNALSKLDEWPFDFSFIARLIPAIFTPFSSYIIELIKKLLL